MLTGIASKIYKAPRVSGEGDAGLPELDPHMFGEFRGDSSSKHGDLSIKNPAQPSKIWMDYLSIRQQTYWFNNQNPNRVIPTWLAYRKVWMQLVI